MTTVTSSRSRRPISLSTAISHCRLLTLLWLLPLFLLSGCASMLSQELAGQLSQAIVNQQDPETVRAGAPAYLLLVDGMIESQPEDRDLLLAGARLNTAYAAVFVEDKERARRMADKAFDYARRALCQAERQACDIARHPFERFSPTLEHLDASDLGPLLTMAITWALWVQQRAEQWEAMAELPKVEAMLERVLAIDETYRRGQAHYYLGILRSLRPPALGGQPEQGRRHFERAIELSAGRDLAVKVAFARYYARLLFERELHDRLLREVLGADPLVPGLTLSNVLAQQEAHNLLRDADSYFLE